MDQSITSSVDTVVSFDAAEFDHGVLLLLSGGSPSPNKSLTLRWHLWRRRIGHRPDKRHNPANKRPAKQYVDHEDGAPVVMLATEGDERRYEVQSDTCHKQEQENNPSGRGTRRFRTDFGERIPTEGCPLLIKQ